MHFQILFSFSFMWKPHNNEVESRDIMRRLLYKQCQELVLPCKQRARCRDASISTLLSTICGEQQGLFSFYIKLKNGWECKKVGGVSIMEVGTENRSTHT